ncbi:outer membrane beta-barrel protein [Flavobacteriaceae bacterium AH-315-O20]|nr:outer membrane beta-barrel protein [Flavobacteriaceae bacterium AH-315-O20]
MAFYFFLFLFISFFTHAQKIEISPQYGYQIGAKYNFYNGYIKLTDSDQFGVTIGAPINDDIQVEFMWAQQNSSVRVRYGILYPTETEVTDITINHYQIGAVHSFGYDAAKPFFGLSAGWTTFNPEENDFSSNTKFTIGISGGLKYFFTDNIGIRLQSQLLMPIDWGGVYFSGGGSGVTVGGTILQLNFSGGLIFAFGN